MKERRELDALVATKVMGWEWDETRCRVCGWPLAGTVAQGCTEENCSMRPVPRYRVDEPPPYSTDLAVAWRAVDRMCDLYDCTIEVKRMASFMPGARYGALVCGGAIEYPRADITAYGHSDVSPAHALCLAMLAALGVPE